MEKTFSKSWKSSTQPRKQRKYAYNAPPHIKGKMLNAPLSKELKTKHGKKSLRVRKGDKVKILRGSFRGKEGKVERVSLKYLKVFIEKVELVKKDGSKVMQPINPSNIMIMDLAEDKKRIKGEKK